MSNKTIVIWVSLVLIIFASILIYGICYKKEHPYLKLEHEIEDAAKEYMKNYEGIKPSEYLDLTITSKELQKENHLKELKFEDKKCSGKVVVSYGKWKYEYSPSIKCK